MRASELSYNRISVDGDTSTNDTLIVLANGASGVRPDPKEMSVFEEALTETLQSLARQIVRDGEGARKLVAVEVHGALRIRPPPRSPVRFRTRHWSRRPSPGPTQLGPYPLRRGLFGLNFDPRKWISRCRTSRCPKVLPPPFDEGEMKLRLDDTDVSIVFRIAGKGKGNATFWTCDLTEDYVHINANYRT